MPVLNRGVSFQAEPTPILNTVLANSAIIVALGTAPVFRIPGGTLVNQIPILMYFGADASKMLGYQATDVFSDWSLSETITAAFSLYGVAPLIAINAWNYNNS